MNRFSFKRKYKKSRMEVLRKYQQTRNSVQQPSNQKFNKYKHFKMRAILFVSPLFIQLGMSLDLERLVRRDTGNGIFNPPKTSSFLQLDLRVTLPANVSTPDGMTALAPNVEGGKATGAFEADILPVGAAYERVALNEAGENSVSEMSTPKSENRTNSCVVLPEPIHLPNRRE